ncbi:MAG: universal stress protein [Candidatus Udaeobacter sp.]
MKTKSSRQSHRAPVKPRRILVPVDFSDSSARALRHAAKRAAESGGSLIIVHVVPADYGWLGIGRDELRDLDRSLQRQAADRLRTFADENVSDELAPELEVRVGQPAEQILAAARESQCDSIMLSTRGLTGLDRYLIGSVADRVARLAPCPVVLLRPGKRAPSREQKPPAVLRIKRPSKPSS